MREPCVMLVEADILIRAPLAEYLRQCGYRVLEVLDTGEARRLLADGSLPVDIVLADVDAPGEGGFALAIWIRGNHAEVEVILSGSVERAAEQAGEICKDGPALSRPYDHRLVLDRIKRLLAARERNA
jgi:DNA-binding response OmpR family regulator